ncbi:amidohydrolase [Cadophora sp. MPI-SDFR-AT-0126]|nr:amidohydrolase [Leotiomycetes sp. MPI-SDFR-AT-0126]
MYLSSLKPLVENICRILVSKFSWTSVQTVTISAPAPTPTPKQTLRFTPSNHNTTTNNVPQNPDFLSLIPPNSWDSHMHILDPLTFPLSPSAHYSPSPALLSTALTTLTQTLHLPNLVLVQPSIYAHDNSCLLSALRTLGPERGRGVVSFDPQMIDASTLREWHVLGVRGVRINLQSVGLGQSVEVEELETMLKRYADVIRPLGWVLQLYVPLEMAVSLERIVPGLGVKVVLDHFGSPDLSLRGVRNPYTIPGFPSLITLLQNGNTYIKISAPYRLTSPNPHQNQPPPNSTTSQDLDAIGRELIKVAGMNRVVFASDWPHTRFEGLDIKPFVKTVMEWCEWDEGLIERVFRGNAEVLWGVEEGEKET